MLLTLDNKLGLAPPNHPDSKVKRVLDVGTGTGIWAIDFGDEHPDATVSWRVRQMIGVNANYYR
jgi:methylase of polypeptide subunit release factors